MATRLMTWNPDRWAWDDVADAAALTAGGGVYHDRWSCGNTTSVLRGERVFLLRQGPEPRGVVGAGWTASDCYEADHWDGQGGTANYADVEFDRVLDPATEPPLDTAQFTDGPLSTVYWAVPASGTQMPDAAAAELEARWDAHLRGLTPPPAKAKRNPPWQRDELILALDLYVRYGGKPLAPTHPEVVELSRLLNALPIHTERGNSQTFRNENGAALKLMNFRRFDPNYSGVGMTRGNRLEEEVWDQFAGDPTLLRAVADGIRAGYPQLADDDADDPEEEGFPEGRVLFRLHRRRERNRAVVRQAKAAAKDKHGRLSCVVCGFDFARAYGPPGDDFIEAHHTTPVSELAADGRTRPSDLALLCSNCHRMVHRRRPWLSLAELGSLLTARS